MRITTRNTSGEILPDLVTVEIGGKSQTYVPVDMIQRQVSEILENVRQLGDDRPHSRACGPMPHSHGTQCHDNCPTCRGREMSE